MNNKEMIETASIKLAIIQPAFNGTFPDATKKQYYERISAVPVIFPGGKSVSYSSGSFACWESDYRKGGFESLMPRKRSDAGKSRKLDDDTMSAIIRIHGEFPRINATEIYNKLIADGIISRKDVSLTTVQRYIKNNNLKGAANPGQKGI